MHLTFYFLCHKSLPKQWTAVTYFYDIKIALSLWIALEKDEHFRPLNSHSFTLCHTVSLPFSQSHGISHGFTNFKRIFLSNSQFPKKTNQATKYCSIAFYIQKKKQTNKKNLEFLIQRLPLGALLEMMSRELPKFLSKTFVKHQSNKKCSFQG